MMRVESLDSESRRLIRVWNALAPPLRPSSEDIEWYEQGWADWEGSKVLIQGVTPELVDLALRKKAGRVIAMDVSDSCFAAMRFFGCENWEGVEALRNDWRNFVPELDGSLDVVMGDGSLTFLDFPAEWKTSLGYVRRYLTPGGCMILRLSFQPEAPFEIDDYIRKTIRGFEAGCAGAGSERRREMLRELVSEIRIAFGVASAGRDGSVDLARRAQMVRLFHSEMDARYGHWEEWELVRQGMPSELDIWKQNRAGKAVPQWNAALELIEACGFRLKQARWSDVRPAPGVMRHLVAERL